MKEKAKEIKDGVKDKSQQKAAEALEKAGDVANSPEVHVLA